MGGQIETILTAAPPTHTPSPKDVKGIIINNKSACSGTNTECCPRAEGVVVFTRRKCLTC